MDNGDPQYLTTREVAALLRVKERKVYDLASSGTLPCRRLMGKLLFSRAEVEAWLSGSGKPVEYRGPAPAPAVIVGSHDPLLDWALRESGSGLAAFFDGSLDGLQRFAAGEAVAAGMHVFEPDREDWNIDHVTAAASDRDCVLIAWARRQQGLIVAPGVANEIKGIADLEGRRIALRQPTSGARLLFDHLVVEAGLRDGDLSTLAAPARTEIDAAATVAEGQADAAFGLEAMARQFRLGFVPIVEEKFDLLISRRAYFEPPLQKLMAFTRTDAFRARAAALPGYRVDGVGIVRWNAG